jgi:hypothetical protein
VNRTEQSSYIPFSDAVDDDDDDDDDDAWSVGWKNGCLLL